MASGNQNNMQNGDREFPYEIVDIDDDMFKKACSYIHGKFFLNHLVYIVCRFKRRIVKIKTYFLL